MEAIFNKALQKVRPLHIAIASGLIFTLLVIMVERIAGSDDTVFAVQMLPYPNVIEWVSYRFASWSGRIIGEAVMYCVVHSPLLIWKTITVAAYLAFSALLFWYNRLFSKRSTRVNNLAIAVAIVCSIFLMDYHVFKEGLLWVTGGTVYFWTSIALIASFMPLAVTLSTKSHMKWWHLLIGILASCVVVLSQEQAGVALIAGLAIGIGYHYLTTKDTPRWRAIFPVAAMLGLSTLLLMLSVFSPGNHARILQETAHWLPDFYAVTAYQRIDWGYRWVLEAVVNHSGILLVAIWLMLLILYKKSHQPSLTLKLCAGFIALASVLVIFQWLDAFSPWTNFYATWHPTIPSVAQALTAYIWVPIGAATITMPLLLFKRPTGMLLSSTLLIYAATVAMITFSPTMYASGWRTLFIPSVILIAAFLQLYYRVIQVNNAKLSYYSVAVVLLFALSHAAFQILHLIAG